jgi:hypothetical protein
VGVPVIVYRATGAHLQGREGGAASGLISLSFVFLFLLFLSHVFQALPLPIKRKA